MTAATWTARGARLPHRLFVLAFCLLTTALVFDLIDLGTGTGALSPVAYWLGASGVVGGVGAGLWRWWRLAACEGASPWQLTALPGFFKAAAVALFAAGWSLRTVQGHVPAAALMLAVLGVALVAAAPLLRAGDGAAASPGAADIEPEAAGAHAGPGGVPTSVPPSACHR